jgi:hypothetical protein
LRVSTSFDLLSQIKKTKIPDNKYQIIQTHTEYLVSAGYWLGEEEKTLPVWEEFQLLKEN